MVFHWSLSHSKPLQVSKTLLSILSDLSFGWTRFASLPILPVPLSKPLLITINYKITFPVILMFHSVFSSLARSQYLSLFSVFYFLFSHCLILLCVAMSWSVYSLKYPYSCFSFHLCFLVIVVMLIIMLFMRFLVTVISLSFFFLLCSFRVLVLMHLRYLNVGKAHFRLFSLHI